MTSREARLYKLLRRSLRLLQICRRRECRANTVPLLKLLEKDLLSELARALRAGIDPALLMLGAPDWDSEEGIREEKSAKRQQKLQG